MPVPSGLLTSTDCCQINQKVLNKNTRNGLKNNFYIWLNTELVKSPLSIFWGCYQIEWYQTPSCWVHHCRFLTKLPKYWNIQLVTAAELTKARRKAIFELNAVSFPTEPEQQPYQYANPSTNASKYFLKKNKNKKFPYFLDKATKKMNRKQQQKEDL